MPSPAIDPQITPSPNLHITRRENLLQLLHAFSKQELANGKPAKGLEVAFGQVLNLSPSMLSQLKSRRNISDKVAAQIEYHAGKAPGWLDIPHPIEVATQAELAFLALAKNAWKSADAKERRRLIRLARNGFN